MAPSKTLGQADNTLIPQRYPDHPKDTHPTKDLMQYSGEKLKFKKFKGFHHGDAIAIESASRTRGSIELPQPDARRCWRRC